LVPEDEEGPHAMNPAEPGLGEPRLDEPGLGEPRFGEPGLAEPGLDGPLLSDATGLHARWQQAQAQFVEDPREAVSDAADLVEQTAQALVGTLQQRQRQLRLLWDHGAADAAAGERAAQGGEPVNGTNSASETERLRLVMQRYRALFSELCRPEPTSR
jgi:hypothetical protein